jgi:beta-lactamase regulating signal transducer with metallopeptidase domain
MTGDAMLLALLGESALRSALLAACVFAALKLSRLRDLRAETAIWTLVLLAACAMPGLQVWAPRGFTVHLPSWVAAPAVVGTDTTARAVGSVPGLAVPIIVYGLIALVGLVRLATGLLLTARLYRLAEPVSEDWARGRAIRSSAAVESPLSFANCILLPADYRAWPQAKRLAVLAHEESHIRRGDFYVQLLACIYRAVFWFSPLAWWLPHKLSELAETASDKAAIGQTNDPAGYAEILLDICRRARGAPVVAAMARGPGVARRVEQILSGAPETALGAAGRVGALSLAMAACLAFAEGRAAIAPAEAQRILIATLATQGLTHTDAVQAPPAHSARHSRRATAASRRPPPVSATVQTTDITYNPRALLDGPSGRRRRRAGRGRDEQLTSLRQELRGQSGRPLCAP